MRPIPTYVSWMFAFTAALGVPVLINEFSMSKLNLIITQLLLVFMIHLYNKALAEGGR